MLLSLVAIPMNQFPSGYANGILLFFRVVRKRSCVGGMVTFVNPANVGLSKLLGEYKSIAILGGGAVYRFMLEQGLLDEIFVTVEPLIFGRGKEMFLGGTRTTQVNLLSVKRLNRTGTLLLHYKINHQ